MKFVYITNNPDVAKKLEFAGVDKVMVDLERIGKHERQKNRNTLISDHNMSDVTRIREVISRMELLVRVNPLHPGSEKEIEDVLSRGADNIMLPMFDHADQVEIFSNIVNERAKTTLLLETAPAFCRIDDILNKTKVDEVHIGLNDLHIDMRLDFMFELFTTGVIDHLSDILKKHSVFFGIGGIAPLSTGILKSNYILTEHRRVGSRQVILSRAFHSLFDENSTEEAGEKLKKEVSSLREFYKETSILSVQELLRNKKKFYDTVNKIVKNLRISEK